MRILWETGVIDASWKCWHCFAVANGQTYLQVISQVRQQQNESDSALRRFAVKPEKLKQSDVRRNTDVRFIAAAADRLMKSLQHAQIQDEELTEGTGCMRDPGISVVVSQDEA